MIRCLNPECFSGERGNPPEYASDNAVDCARCGNEIDLDDEPNFEADEGGVICAECRHRPRGRTPVMKRYKIVGSGPFAVLEDGGTLYDLIEDRREAKAIFSAIRKVGSVAWDAIEDFVKFEMAKIQGNQP